MPRHLVKQDCEGITILKSSLPQILNSKTESTFVINDIDKEHHVTICFSFKSLSLQVDMTDYPFDVQSCSLRFGSWSYDTKRLDLHFMDGFEVCFDVPCCTHSDP